MRLLLALILICAALGARAQDIRVSPPNNGQYPGVTSNTAANAGNIGEYVTSLVASPGAAITSTVTGNITSVSLTPGEWACHGQVAINPAGTTVVTNWSGGVSSTTANIDITKGGYAAWAGPTTGNSISLAIPPTQFLLSSTTTIFLTQVSVFSTSTATAWGFIGCRRVH